MRQGTRKGRRILEVRGEDRVKWLNGLVTCDVSKLALGQSTWGLLVARKGKILSDLVVAAPEEGLLVLDVDADAATAAHEHLEHHLIMEDVELTLRDDAPGVVAGADAESTPASAALPQAGFITAAEPAALTFGAPGAADDGGALFEELRFTHGWPAFRVDYDDAFYPQEAGLEGFAVAFDKGCYLGQEVVFMLQVRGKVKRRLALLQLPAGGAPPERGTKITKDGKEIGETTSAHGTRAFALLRENAWERGTELRVGDATATVL